MKFLYSVIGDNTAENREWLEMVGYKGYSNTDREFIITNCPYASFEGTNEYMKVLYPIIPCIGNDKLFQAVSAITDNEYSDINKPFICIEVDTKRHIKNEAEFGKQPCAKIGDIIISPVRQFNREMYHYGKWRKATLPELQEHFKK